MRRSNPGRGPACAIAAVLLLAGPAFGAPPAPSRPAPAEAVKAFRAARTKDEPAADLAAAVRALGETPAPEVARALRDYLAHDAPEVRIAAAEALGRQPAPEAARALEAAVAKNGGRPDVLQALLASLAALGDADASDAIARLIPGDDDAVARQAAGGLGRLAHPKSIDALARLLDAAAKPAAGNGPAAEKQKRLQGMQDLLIKALQEAADRKHATPEAWASWWGAARATCAPPGADGPCAPVPGMTVAAAGMSGPPTAVPPAQQPDFNLKLRGRVPAGGSRRGYGLTGFAGDPKSSRLNTLFADEHVPSITGLWDVGVAAGGVAKGIEKNGPHLCGLRAIPGEILQCPASDYETAPGLAARVLYANGDSLVLDLAIFDDPLQGYVIYVMGIAVEPSLLHAYQKLDAGGRHSLPALRSKQPIGRARGREILVGVRDNGTFVR